MSAVLFDLSAGIIDIHDYPIFSLVTEMNDFIGWVLPTLSLLGICWLALAYFVAFQRTRHSYHLISSVVCAGAMLILLIMLQRQLTIPGSETLPFHVIAPVFFIIIGTHINGRAYTPSYPSSEDLVFFQPPYQVNKNAQVVTLARIVKGIVLGVILLVMFALIEEYR